MTFTAADPIPSGVPFPVDPTVHALGDFVGEVTFTVQALGGDREVYGVGAEDGDTVRVHEKSRTGKDVRCWRVSAAGTGFTAEVDSVY